MKIHKLTRSDGQAFAFEVDNAYIRPKTIGRLVSKVRGVSDVNVRKAFSSSADVHVEFKYQGKDFIVLEPYGDNSRYWIGPNEECNEIDITQLEQAFEQYQLPKLSKFFGDLISLSFKL